MKALLGTSLFLMAGLALTGWFIGQSWQWAIGGACCALGLVIAALIFEWAE